MSTDPGLAAVPSGPPWSIDVLADLQAGVYSDEVSAQLRSQIADDQEAKAILAALDSTVDDLSLLPEMRMPERFALRLDAAIAAEATRAGGSPERPLDPAVARGAAPSPSAGPPPTFRPGPPPAPPTFRPLTIVPPQSPQQFAPAAPPPGPPTSGESSNVVSLDAARTKRRRWIVGIGVAAAVAAAATITVASLNRSTGGTGTQADAGPAATAPATPGASPNALDLQPGRFQDAYSQINGSSSGPLTNPITYAGCMAANKIAQNEVLGVKQVTYQGKEASAVAVEVDATHAKILVVSLQCGVDGGADILASETVTR